ncbi:MAG: MMPL family transporter [Desulfobacterales bacterium]|nr:MMPL family transporter [Desulfobacterales bacterium]
MKSPYFSLPRFLVALSVVTILFCIGLYRLEIDTNVVELLPQKDPAISDALYVLKNHPMMDQLVIDVSHPSGGPDRLVEYGTQIEERLRESGLFNTVGMEAVQHLMPDLMSFVLSNLPVMFTEKELADNIGPMLETEQIRKRLTEMQLALLNLEGIGQAEFIEKDPLGLKDIVMARLAALAPSQNARIYRGKLISADDKHLLVIATPKSSGTDSLFARRTDALLKNITQDLNRNPSASGDAITLTPVGAYRAALDNEQIVRRDVKKAIAFSTIGISLLLLFAFPRPYIGLLSLLPAAAGTMTAFFIFSLLNKSISIMVLGFGGGIISISVDFGIAYLLFLDRPQRTNGREASHEVWSCGLLAALTTVGAFGALCFSGFPLFEQLGLFTALGISFSFLFVHTVFPLIFPALPPARLRPLPLQGFVNRLALSGNKGAWAALAFALFMLFFAKPTFNVDLSSMNTVSKDTAAAEKLMTSVWGQVFNRVYLLIRGDSIDELQQQGDRLLQMLDQDLAADTLSSRFASALIFPGEDRRRQNLAAWKSFWNTDRIHTLSRSMEKVSAELGFTTDAFSPFYQILRDPPDLVGNTDISEKFLGLMNITKSPDGADWVQVVTVTAADSHDAEKFYARYKTSGKIFDPVLFSQRLGTLLFATFLKMLQIISISVVLLLLLFFLDLKLTLAALLPIGFAFISTLGTLTLMGRPLDIPGLMLSVIIIGMGIDYSLFFIGAYQRYADPLHPSYGLIRLAVFMASASTIIGFGILCTAEHTLLRSAGLTSLLGIGYAAIGAFVILPPVLNHLARHRKIKTPKAGNHSKRVLRRYQFAQSYPRLFAYFKMRFDPMFAELPALMESIRAVRIVMDIGCGYGVPACWLLERFPEAMVYGIDPDPERVRVTSMAVGENGVVTTGRAPELPGAPGPADLVMMLDMLHYITDDEFRITLQRLKVALAPNGSLIIRAALPPKERLSRARAWWIEGLKNKISGMKCYYRSMDEIATIIQSAGYTIERSLPSGSNGDLVWVEVKPVKNLLK